MEKDLSDKPTMMELSRAVRRLRNDKAGGKSGILPELLKCGSASFLEYLLDLLHTVWDEGSVPQDWVNADIVPVPKKGATM